MSYENVKCPECGGPMVSRKSKHGIFWGCKEYPLCRGTRDNMGRSKQEKNEQAEENNDMENEPRWDR